MNSLPDTVAYQAVMAGYQGHQKFINMFRDWRSRKNRYDMKLSITELWTAYFGIDWFFTDRLHSLESGLWTADHIMQSFENYDLIDVVNHTSNSGVFERGYDDEGKRKILGTPTFYALSLLTNHSGEFYHNSSAITDKFDAVYPNLPWEERNVPWLRQAVTSDEDSLYIALINKHYSKKCELKHNLNLVTNSTIMHYELFSDKFTDRNLPNGSNKIFPRYKAIQADSVLSLNKNSLNIFAIPKSAISTSIDIDSSIKIYPNPAYDSIVLAGLPDSLVKITIYDLSGKIILKLSSSQTEISIDIRTISSGIYNIILEFENKQKIKHSFFKY